MSPGQSGSDNYFQRTYFQWAVPFRKQLAFARSHSPNDSSAIPVAGRRLPSAAKTPWLQALTEHPLPNPTACPRPSRMARRSRREARPRAASFLFEFERQIGFLIFLRNHGVSPCGTDGILQGGWFGSCCFSPAPRFDSASPRLDRRAAGGLGREFRAIGSGPRRPERD